MKAIRIETTIALIALIFSIGSLIVNYQTEKRLERLFGYQTTWNKTTGQSVEALLKEAIRQIDKTQARREIGSVK